MKTSLAQILLTLLILTSCNLTPASSQAQNAKEAKKKESMPSISWGVSGTTPKGATISEFVIRNAGKEPLLNEEWELWFNSMRLIDPSSVKIGRASCREKSRSRWTA